MDADCHTYFRRRSNDARLVPQPDRTDSGPRNRLPGASSVFHRITLNRERYRFRSLGTLTLNPIAIPIPTRNVVSVCTATQFADEGGFATSCGTQPPCSSTISIFSQLVMRGRCPSYLRGPTLPFEAIRASRSRSNSLKRSRQKSSGASEYWTGFSRR